VFRDTRAIEPLAAAARDDNPDVRAAAGTALELHTDVGLLIDALDEPTPLVRKNAEYALFLMTGRDFGADSERWRQWKNRRHTQPEE
jgi:HEAT repeat protein